MRKTQPFHTHQTEVVTPHSSSSEPQRENWKSWLPTWLLVIVTVWAVWVARGTLHTLDATLQATQSQADAASKEAKSAMDSVAAARAQTELSERAWIGLVAAPTRAGRPELKREGGDFNSALVPYSFEIKNFGNSPATNIGAGNYFLPAGLSEPIDAMRDACLMNSLETSRLTPYDPDYGNPNGKALFPGETATYSSSPWSNEIKRPHVIVVWILLCVEYMDRFGPHRTEYWYDSVDRYGIHSVPQTPAIKGTDVLWPVIDHFELFDCRVRDSYMLKGEVASPNGMFMLTDPRSPEPADR